MKPARESRGGIPVAIVGIGCRFPGEVSDVAGFWRLLAEGRDAITEIPADRIDLAHFFDPRPATPGHMMTRRGGYLSRIEEFDPGFFGIAPIEAECMDPQQRLLLETAWEALEDAGEDIAALDGTNAAVFMGQWTSDFENRVFSDPDLVNFPMTLGSGRYGAAARLSYVLGLRGSCLSVDAACSSGLACVHLAVQSLRAGECELALAGAANLILQPHIHVAYSQSRMMAPDGHCKFGDARGDGYVRSEGVGVLVLKALDRAIADGDRVYAVIRGSYVNNDGRSSGSMGRPSRIGQEELLRQAYSDAGVDPAAVGYVEAHGTGTRAGDPVELDSIAKVIGAGRTRENGAWVGSVKTNIGHTEATAGIAGIIKAALVLRNGRIPPSLHFKEPNPSIPWAELPLAIPTRMVDWPKGAAPRVAGVSAYGIGGTNAHVVLEEAPASASEQADGAPAGARLLVLSARSPEALRALAGRYAELLSADGAPSLRDACWSAATRRTALSHRAAFVAIDSAAMAKSLRAYAAGEAATADGIAAPGPRPRVAFVAPGQGAQWTGMGRELLASEPVFRAALERCDAAARPWIDFSIVEQLALEPGQPGYRLDQIDAIQPALVALAIAYAELLRSKGIEPDAFVGHSMGEVAAAYLAGVIDLGRAMQVICRRSALMRRSAGKGAMALVELPLEDARKRIAGREDRIAIAGNYSPRASVISGDPGTVKQVLAELEKDGVFCRLVKVDVASHSPQMDPHAADLAGELAGMAPQAARIPIHSTVLDRRVEGAELDAGYWARNLRQPVLFGGRVGQLIEEGASIFVELGPHPVLLPFVQQTAQAASREVATLVCGRRAEPEGATLLAACAGLWAAGYPVDWAKLLPDGGRNVALPLYPWQRERHWTEAATLGAASPGARVSRRRADDESTRWLHRLEWQVREPRPAAAADAAWLVVSADAREGAALAEGMAAAGAPARFLSLPELKDALAAGTAGFNAAGGIVVLAASSDDAAYLPIRVLHMLPTAAGRARPRLWFATRGSQVAGDSKPGPVAVEQAAAWGAARAIAEEHPDLWGGLVDLDPAANARDNGAQLAAHLRAADGEDQVALRGRRFALRLVADPAAGAAAPMTWRADASYLVTGGLGVLAPHIIRDMAAHGARRFVLLGRTALPPREEWGGVSADGPLGRRIRDIHALEAAGLAIHLANADAGDEAQLRAFLDAYRAQGWPPIRGVIHAAGSQSNRLASDMDAASFDAVMRPKLTAARNLDRLLPELDAFVLFSSIGSFLLQGGDANYAAANAGLDALAHDRRARGQHGLSIAWGRWRDTGLVGKEAGERVIEEMSRQGLHGIAPEKGAALFSRLCAQPAATAVVLPVDWAAFRAARPGRAFPMLRDLMAGVAPAPAAGADLQAELARAAPAQRRQMVESLVRECVGRVLKIVPARLDPRKALGSLGLNSLMAMELRNRLEGAMGRSLSATLAWNYPTVEALVEHLAGADAPAKAAAVEVAAPQPAGAMQQRLAQVAAGSDEEAALALRKSRPRKS